MNNTIVNIIALNKINSFFYNITFKLKKHNTKLQSGAKVKFIT
jgi:hypothetical protein